MRSISAALEAHLAGDVTTLANLWLVTRKDGRVFGFTDHDSDIVYGGVTYAAATGFSASNVQTSGALNVSNLEVSGMLASPSITEADMLAGVWDHASITLSQCNYKDLTMGVVVMRSGTLGQIKLNRSNFVAELRGLTQPLQQSLLEYYTPSCRATLGDARCKVVMTPYTVSGSVASGIVGNQSWLDPTLTATNSTRQAAITGITRANPALVTSPGHGFTSGQQVSIAGVNGMTQINGRIATVTFVSVNQYSLNIDSTLFGIYTNGGTATLFAASEYYQGGTLTWTSGLNNGLSMEVKSYYPGWLQLFNPMPYAIAAGDTYTLSAGCDKLLSTCKNRFANVVNFRGEPHIPGLDTLMQHG